MSTLRVYLTVPVDIELPEPGDADGVALPTGEAVLRHLDTLGKGYASIGSGYLLGHAAETLCEVALAAAVRKAVERSAASSAWLDREARRQVERDFRSVFAGLTERVGPRFALAGSAAASLTEARAAFGDST